MGQVYQHIALKISPKFVPKVRINNIPALVQIMAWRRPGDKPLTEPMMVSLLTHICVIRHQLFCYVIILYVITRSEPFVVLKPLRSSLEQKRWRDVLKASNLLTFGNVSDAVSNCIWRSHSFMKTKQWWRFESQTKRPRKRNTWVLCKNMEAYWYHGVQNRKP